MEGWLSDNWFNLVSAVGIISGLFFTGLAVRDDADARRIANLFLATRNHRDLWRDFTSKPSLERVLDPHAEPWRKPVTREEEFFVISVILHLSGVFYALQKKLYIEQQGLMNDAGWFFSLPIPRAVWEQNKFIQNRDFVAYVDASVKGVKSRGSVS